RVGSSSFARILSASSLTFTASFWRYNFCSLSMETISFSSASSRTTWVFGTFTSIPDWITGAVTIKIMSNTRTISMKGTMLISANVVCVLPSRVVIAIRLWSSLQCWREFPFGVHPIVRRDFGSDRQNGCRKSPRESLQTNQRQLQSGHRQFRAQQLEVWPCSHWQGQQTMS